MSNSREDIKIFGIGLNKTGTTSLAVALRELGYTNGITWINNHLMDIYDQGEIEFFLSMSEDYTFFEDIPWALLYKEFHQKYPNAYFILTTRKDPQTWYKSHCKHIVVNSNMSYSNSIVYEAPDPLYAKQKFISHYNKHNNEVRSYFKGNPRFIEVCWENGDGWEELCQLLSKKIPQKDFPHLNQLHEKEKTLKDHIFKYLIKRKKIHIKNYSIKPVEFNQINHIVTNGNKVIITGVSFDENGYSQIHKPKLLLSDGISSIKPSSIESFDRQHFNKVFPYIKKGEKVGFTIKFTFNYEIPSNSVFTIQINENTFRIPSLTKI